MTFRFDKFNSRSQIPPAQFSTAEENKDGHEVSQVNGDHLFAMRERGVQNGSLHRSYSASDIYAAATIKQIHPFSLDLTSPKPLDLKRVQSDPMLSQAQAVEIKSHAFSPVNTMEQATELESPADLPIAEGRRASTSSDDSSDAGLDTKFIEQQMEEFKAMLDARDRAKDAEEAQAETETKSQNESYVKIIAKLPISKAPTLNLDISAIEKDAEEQNTAARLQVERKRGLERRRGSETELDILIKIETPPSDQDPTKRRRGSESHLELETAQQGRYFKHPLFTRTPATSCVNLAERDSDSFLSPRPGSRGSDT